VKSHAHISCIQTLSFSSFLFLVLVLFLSLSFVVDRERSKCGSERKCGRVVNKRERKDLGLREREGGQTRISKESVVFPSFYVVSTSGVRRFQSFFFSLSTWVVVTLGLFGLVFRLRSSD
jgi:hypothetical protein